MPKRRRKLTKSEIRRVAQESLGLPIRGPDNPQAFYHFRREHQVDDLATAREEGPDLAFMARVLALCSLPRTNPGRRTRYIRKNGPYTLVMMAGEHGLPFGNLPRLLMAWVCTQAVLTQSPTLLLGRSLAEFMGRLGIKGDSGGKRGDRTRLRNQMRRLFGSAIQLSYAEKRRAVTFTSAIATRSVFWWDPKQPAQPTLWNSAIELAEEFYREIIRRPFPLAANVLKALKRSPLGLDLYLWLAYRTFGMKQDRALRWRDLYGQFGADPRQVGDKLAVNDFRKEALRELKKIKLAWRGFNYSLPRGKLVLHPTPPIIIPMYDPVGRRDDRHSGPLFPAGPGCPIPRG